MPAFEKSSANSSTMLYVAVALVVLPIVSCGGCLAWISFVGKTNIATDSVETRDSTANIDKHMLSEIIPGLAAVDITGNLENQGFVIEKRFGVQLEYICRQKNNECSLTAEAFGNSPDQLTTIRAMGLDFADDPTKIRDFLAFVSTTPFAGSRPEQAKQWVYSNFGSNIETTFGPCTFTLEHSDRSWILTIRPTK